MVELMPPSPSFLIFWVYLLLMGEGEEFFLLQLQCLQALECVDNCVLGAWGGLSISGWEGIVSG